MKRKVFTWLGFFGGILGLLSEDGHTQYSPSTLEMSIPTDLPPPASAEDIMPTHPFFAAPSSANEVLDRVEELEERVQKLESNAPESHVTTRPDGVLSIESKGDIEIITPGTVKFKAKSVELPHSRE